MKNDKRKPWMFKEAPVKLEANQIELDELKKLMSYDESDTENIGAIKKFYSMLYQHVPSKNIIELTYNNLYHNIEKYHKPLKHYNDRGVMIGSAILAVGMVMIARLSFFDIDPSSNYLITSYLCLSGGLITLYGASFGPIKRRFKTTNYYLKYSGGLGEDLEPDFADRIAELMNLAIKKDGSATMKELGQLANLGITYLDRDNYSRQPNEEELNTLKKLETKITNEKTIKEFLTDIKNDMLRVRTAKYEGYKNDLTELSILAQDVMLDCKYNTSNANINLKESDIGKDLYDRLISLEKRIDGKINLESIADKSLDSQIESLSTNRDVSGLEQVSKLKLMLKKQ